MSYVSNPVAVTGSIITIPNPASGINVSPVQCQIRNASSWVITTSAYGQTYLLDPYTAVTMDVQQGQSMILAPSLDAFPDLPDGYVSAEWLLANETPVEPDGPLTAAATIAAISGSITSEAVQFSLTNSPFLLTGTSGSKTFTIPANSPSFDTVTLLISNGSDTSFTVSVTGATTGFSYLSQTMVPVIFASPFNSPPICFPFASSVEPGGLILTWSGQDSTYGSVEVFVLAGGANPIDYPVVDGPGATGPSATSAGIGSTTGMNIGPAGTISQIIRIWSVWLQGYSTVAADATVKTSSGMLLNFLQLPSNSSPAGLIIPFEGGLAFPNTAHVQVITSNTDATVIGGIAYSIDAA